MAIKLSVEKQLKITKDKLRAANTEKREWRTMAYQLEMYAKELNEYIDKLELENKTLKSPFGLKEMEKGKRGEDAAMEYYRKQGYYVMDMSDDPEYRKRDIDFLIIQNGNEFGIEAKYCTKAYETNTIIVEDILNIEDTKEGWLHYCEADFIAFVSENKIWELDTEDLRDFISKVKKNEPGYKAEAKIVNNNSPIFGKYKSKLYYVNLDAYRAAGYYVEEGEV